MKNNKQHFYGTTIMEKIFTLILATCAFALAGCNTSVGPDPDDKAVAEELILTDGYLYTVENDASFPGAEVNLQNLLGAGESILDISKYASVTVDAALYSDVAGTTPAVKANPGDNIAQFTLLKSTGSWDIPSNQCAPTKYNMAIDGETAMIVPAGASGVPLILLLQANWDEFPNAVKSIMVRTITFTPKTDDVTLEVVYGSAVSVSGNRIIFNEARNNNGAAFYRFSTGELSGLGSKTVTVSYTVVGYSTADDVEQQLVIQSGGDGNGEANTDGNAQWYPVLDTPSGTFDVEGSELLSRAGAKGFTLTGFRISNNGGTTDTDASSPNFGNTRQLSYTLVIDSVTVW